MISRLVLAATFALLATVLGGCAHRADLSDVTHQEGVSGDATPDVEAPGDDLTLDHDGRWVCVPVDGPGTGIPVNRDETWVAEGALMVSAHRSEEPGGSRPGWGRPEEAVADAVASATSSALGLLENRGIAYADERRRTIVSEAVESSSRGDGIAFPRLDITETSIEQCVAGESPADTCWRAAVVVEYHIGRLRGDANNVWWERTRAANEARTLKNSAREHFANGRWMDGLLDAARSAEAVLDTGVPVAALEASPDSAGTGAPRTNPERRVETSRELVGLLEWSRQAAVGAVPLEAGSPERVTVVDAGESVAEDVTFDLSYVWEGRTVPASGVPVSFRMNGASAVLDGDAVSDGRGTATCRILKVNGRPGEYALELRLNSDAAEAALSWLRSPGEAPTSDREVDDPLLATAVVHVVKGAHATPVCVDIDSDNAMDAPQAATGFARRMERDGFRLVECGPEAAVVITGAVSLTAVELDSGWRASAALTASAFDQRTALGLGETTVTATETVGANETEDARRSAEVLALKEAGRLLAVYFGGRILSSGS